MSITIYVVSQFAAHYEDSETILLKAFYDKAVAQAMVDEFNARPTLNSLIQDMMDTFIDNLEDTYVAPPFDQGPRPAFEQSLRHDADYKRSYNATMKARGKAQKAYQKQIAQERAALRKKTIDEYRGSLYGNTSVAAIKAAHVLRDAHTSYQLDCVELE